MTRALYSIAIHKRLVQGGGKISIDPSRNSFYVDTEFLPVAAGKRATIYDIGIVNKNDYFKSIATLVDCGRTVYNRIKHSQFSEAHVDFEYEDLEGCPTIDKIVKMFLDLFKDNEVAKLYYYHANHDISWFTEYRDFNSSKDGKITTIRNRAEDDDMDAEINDVVIATDVYAEGASALPRPLTRSLTSALPRPLTRSLTSALPRPLTRSLTLSKEYQRVTGNYIENMPHIILHTAISDALILMEYHCTNLQ